MDLNDDEHESAKDLSTAQPRDVTRWWKASSSGVSPGTEHSEYRERGLQIRASQSIWYLAQEI
jgi:hypothetical protein